MSTILLIDDNLYVIEVFVEMLTQGGYSASAAYGGEECLKILKKKLHRISSCSIL